MPALGGTPKRLTYHPGEDGAVGWTPDGRKIAYMDSNLGFWSVDLEQKKPVLVDRDYYVPDRDSAPAWSPDSKWLAYRKQLKNYMSAICLYSLADSKSTQVTDGMSEAGPPVFDKDGKYLYFTASTDSGPPLQPSVLSQSHPVTRSIEAELDPKAVRQGHDPQLEKAVAVVMEELAKNPVPQPKHPPYPNYHAK